MKDLHCIYLTKLCSPTSVLLEAGIFLSHIIWLFRTRKLRKRAKLEGIDFDDLPEARRWQWHPEESARPGADHADSEPGNTNTDLNMTEHKVVLSGNSELQRVAAMKDAENHQSTISDCISCLAEDFPGTQLQGVEKRQSVTTASDLGSTEPFEVSWSKKVDSLHGANTVSDLGTVDKSCIINDGEKRAFGESEHFVPS